MPTSEELLAFLDEQLPVDRMAEIERMLRESESLRLRLAGLARQLDPGHHSVGAIWRRGRLSCPTRSQLGSFLLGALEEVVADYVDFHLRTVGCRLCEANLRDLQQVQSDVPETKERRRKFFQSSAGYLRSSDR